MTDSASAHNESAGVNVADRPASLQVCHLAKSYATATEPLTILTDVDLHLQGGQSAAIVGPSGSGKSTLLHILGTLDPPDSGSVLINQQDPFVLPAKELAMFRNRTIGFVFQDQFLLPQLTVMENVLVPALAHGSVTTDDRHRALDLLQSVGLSERLSHLPGQLSGGERERVAIARALVMGPSLILADEPTGNLDRRTAQSITELLIQLQRQSGAVMICVTHSDALAEALDQRFELADGRLISPR